MAINPDVSTYGTYDPKHYLAVVDVDISKAYPNDPTRTTAKALAMVMAGSIGADGTFTPGGAQTVTVEQQPLPAGTNRSAAVGVAAANIMPANPARLGGFIQNISANIVGINEFGVAAIGSLGTTTLAAGATYEVKTSNAISAIASVAASDVTAIEW